MPPPEQGDSHRDSRAAMGNDDLRADYAAWRDRMKKKSERVRTTINLDAKPEPTPKQVLQAARKAERDDVETWARTVQNAAFGPDEVDASVEEAVREVEPGP